MRNEGFKSQVVLKGEEGVRNSREAFHSVWYPQLESECRDIQVLVRLVGDGLV